MPSLVPMTPYAVLMCALVMSVAVLGSANETTQDVPGWLEKLFPHTGPPGRAENRLRRVVATQVASNGGTAWSVIVEVRYPDLYGEQCTGLGRIFLPEEISKGTGKAYPLIHNAGYELDEASGVRLAARGYVVSTPHAHPLNPLGRGVHLDRALLHAVSALPLVDSRRIGIQGGSAGGWMTLMLAADAFPLVYAMPDVPPVHWGYNAAYIARNQHVAGPVPGSDQPRLPVLQVVAPIAEQSLALYNQPFDHATYLAVSPLAHLTTITAPTLLTFSTADVLVPIEQVGRRFCRPEEPGRFPAGYDSELGKHFPGIRGKQSLLDLLPRERYRLFVVKPPANAPRLSANGSAAGQPVALTLPFDTERSFSIVILDEGPREPDLGHFKYAWALDQEPFRSWAERQQVQPQQLTRAKLERLMKRYLGEAWVPFTVRRKPDGPEVPANALDFPEAERADVVRGLRAFAEDDRCAEHLAHLYKWLPRRYRVLGEGFSDGSAHAVRATLEALIKGETAKGREPQAESMLSRED